MATLSTYLSFVRVSHTVFALPFAFTGALLAAREASPPWTSFVWILVCMVSARSAAMGFNRIVDAMTLEDSKQLVAICTEVVEQYGYVLVLTDNTRAGVPTPGARKFQTEQLRRPLHPSQTVVYGSSLIGRTSVSMVLRAVALFTGQRLPIAMVADEKSARELLSAARERFRAQGIAKR